MHRREAGITTVRIVLWTAFIATLAILWGRELAAYFSAARFGEATDDDRARLRRRSLGLGVLLLMAAMADAGSWVEKHFELQNDAPRMLAYYGVCFVLLIWLLIIASRDFRALSSTWVRDRDKATMDFLDRIEREMARDDDEDTRPIPRIQFPKDR